MTEIKASDLLPRLQSEFKYSEKSAQRVAEKLMISQQVIKTAFLKWWRTGEFTQIEVESYTWKSLMEQHNLNPIAALLTLDWLTREPEKAKQSLTKGHDFVKIKR